MTSVEEHYAQAGLMERVREALRQSGFDPDHLEQSALEGVDQFHIGGLDSTNEMIRLAGIQSSDRVLDLGSGIGGPSRHLASTVGCHVVGLDLTEEYCAVAAMLAASTGLTDLVSYRRGNAIETPFEDASFDVVWTQHAAMNIADKGALYREAFRVLRTKGKLAVHDIVAGSGEVRYPVPWASRVEFSFLISPEGLRQAATAAGFQEVVSQDVTQAGIAALKRVAGKGASPGFGVRTLMGPGFPVMAGNLIANLEAGACRVMEFVFVKEV